MIRIAIVDDQELIRESLKIIINSDSDFEVASVAESGSELLEFLEKDAVDVVLMDVRMPEMTGVECTRIVKKKYPQTKVIILTTFDDDEYIFDALKYGASGYLLKGCSLEELRQAIHNVLEGGACFNPNVAGKVARFFTQMANSPSPVVENTTFDTEYELSDTEWKIIEQVGLGASNKEIAASLHFSEGTIRNYLSVILDKLSLRDRTQLAIWYVSRGKNE